MLYIMTITKKDIESYLILRGYEPDVDLIEGVLDLIKITKPKNREILISNLKKTVEANVDLHEAVILFARDPDSIDYWQPCVIEALSLNVHPEYIHSMQTEYYLTILERFLYSNKNEIQDIREKCINGNIQILKKIRKLSGLDLGSMSVNEIKNEIEKHK